MNEIITALLLTLVAGSATGIGGAMVLFKKKLSSNFLAGALGLSAGVMLFISLAELYPEAQSEIIANASGAHGKAFVLIAFFIGMGIITLIDFLIPEYENPHEAPGLSLGERTAAVDMLQHTDNAVALNNPEMGAGITFAIALHNIPEGIAVAIPIYYATRSRGKALFYATLSGLSELLGALLCICITSLFGIELTGQGMAFPLILSAVAGIMVYISLDELLPTAEKYGKHHIAIGGVVAGMAIMAVSLLFI